MVYPREWKTLKRRVSPTCQTLEQQSKGCTMLLGFRELHVTVVLTAKEPFMGITASGFQLRC